MGQALHQFSQELAGLYASVGQSVVAIAANQRHTSSGISVGQNQILTAEHAVHREEGITVTLPDGTTTQAHLVARDAAVDLALLEFDEPGPEIPQLERVLDLEAVPVGGIVLAVARSPEDGLGATFGVLSCRSGNWRTWKGARVEAFLQPDAALYPGFSGGPLVDTQGRLIGLNTSGLTRGTSVTLPWITLDRIVEQLRRPGLLGRAYLGVGLRSVQLPAKQSQLAAGGAMVVNLEAGSAAERDGLLLGDIIVSLNDNEVDSSEEATAALSELQAGQVVKIRLVRAGEVVETELTPSERPQRGCR